MRAGRCIHPIATLFELASFVNEQRDVAAIIDDELRALAAGKRHGLQRQIPILLERFALPGEHRRAGLRDGGGSVILGRENIARSPAHIGAEFLQRLNQHRRLNRHVQRARDANAGERLLRDQTFFARPSSRAFHAQRWRFLCGPIRTSEMSLTRYGGDLAAVVAVAMMMIFEK